MPRRREFPPICVALGCAETAELERLAREACASGERFLEVRMDLLREPQQALGVIRGLKDRYPDVLVLATCRRQEGGGEFRGSVEEQMRLLEAAVEAGAEAVDVEVESAAAERSSGLRGRAKRILSYHNFERTPALGPVLRRLEKTPADVYKIVTMARRPTDNWRVLDLAARRRAQPLVALAMGEAGLGSRVLSLSRGAAFTYASPGGSPTAPGQVPAALLRRQYRAERLTADTPIYGVIASPIAHSISPAVHNRAFQARRIDAVYLPFLVEPGQLVDFLTLAKRLPIAGFSVTIPHKQKILRRLAAVDPLARRVGAVNTVYRKGGTLRGTNTDAPGVTAPLEKRLRLRGSQVVVVGSGGAARAAAFALADRGARVFLAGRHAGRVQALARACGAVALDGLAGRRFDALVHATPVGMHPLSDATLFPGEIPAEVVFDMVYNPLETRLLREARAAGKKVISGLEMFLEQAAAQFEIWTGAPAPRAAMERAARQALAEAPP